MLFKGQLAATYDPNLAQCIAAEPNSKIIFLGDVTGNEEQIRYYHMITASPLVPDYSVLESDVNGNDAEFNARYNMYLSSEPAVMYFSTIMAALMLGKNVLLYFPPDIHGLRYPSVLLNHIVQVYGIQTRTENIPFGYNEAFTPNNAALMYRYNIINPQTYLTLSGDTFVNMIPKLSFDIGIPVSDPSQFNNPQLIEYINNYRINILKTGKPLIKPFTREVICNANND